MKNITVTIDNNKYKYPQGTTLYEISKDFKKNYKSDILISKVDGKVVELSDKLINNSKIEFFDYTSKIGNIAYQNGLIFMLIYVLKKYFDINIKVKHSIDKGVLIETDKKINNSTIIKIELKMNEVCKENIIIQKKLINRLEAIKYYKNIGEVDKVNILKYSTNTNINLYKINDMYDYFYSYLPYSTGQIKKYKLSLINSYNFVLSYPNIYINGKTKKYEHHEKLFNEFEDYSRWGNTIDLNSITDINKRITESNFEDIILLSENYQNNKLFEIAKTISKNNKIKMILMSGPSSSGKTTTSRKLKLFLKSFGLNPISISLDDYYLNRLDTPKKPDGTYDFESINAIDVNLFNKHISDLLSGKKVKVPKYNFILGRKEYNNDYIKMNENDLLIVEGLHALNKKISSNVNKENKYKIYLSPLTVINIDNHNRVRTTDNRLLRRIVRDNRTRGYSCSKTLSSWQNVRIGEEENVFKFQDEADIIFNTSLIYELNVLKTYVEPLLYSVDENDPNYNEAIRLLNLLKNLLPVPSELVPSDSIIREFIGNSYFNGE